MDPDISDGIGSGCARCSADGSRCEECGERYGLKKDGTCTACQPVKVGKLLEEDAPVRWWVESGCCGHGWRDADGALLGGIWGAMQIPVAYSMLHEPASWPNVCSLAAPTVRHLPRPLHTCPLQPQVRRRDALCVPRLRLPA